MTQIKEILKMIKKNVISDSFCLITLLFRKTFDQ